MRYVHLRDLKPWLVTASLAVLYVAGAASAQPAAIGPDALSDRMAHRGVSVASFVRSDGTTLPQRIRRGAGGAVRLSIGPGGRGEPLPRGARRSTLALCGVEAVRTEIAMPGRGEERTSEGDRHLIAPSLPPTTYVRVELTWQGHRVRVEWAVRTGRRATLRAVEDEFFGSIRCE
jgi:hypothetical protein